MGEVRKFGKDCLDQPAWAKDVSSQDVRRIAQLKLTGLYQIEVMEAADIIDHLTAENAALKAEIETLKKERT